MARTDTRDTTAPAVRVGWSSCFGAAVSTGRFGSTLGSLPEVGPGCAEVAAGAGLDEEAVGLGATVDGPTLGAAALLAAGPGTCVGAGSEHPATSTTAPATIPVSTGRRMRCTGLLSSR
ncbi:MAG: hypothetical protein ACRYG2_27460 [Janthinobacterium lividum]